VSEPREPDFHWGGRPVFVCPHCPYERVENLDAVLRHEAEAHRPVIRESQLVGPGGEPLLMAEEPEAEGPMKQARRRGK
jgi:hypothetical protein